MKPLGLILLSYLLACVLGAQLFGPVPGLNFLIMLLAAPLAARIPLLDLIKIYVIYSVIWDVAHFLIYVTNLTLTIPWAQNLFYSLAAKFPAAAPLLQQAAVIMPFVFLMLIVVLSILEGVFAALLVKIVAAFLPKRLKIEKVGY